MIARVIMVVATLTTVSCKSDLEYTAEEAKRAQIVYIRDRGLCFAFIYSEYGNQAYAGLSEVDCDRVPSEAQ